MATEVKAEVRSQEHVPEKCTQCQFLDTETDHMLVETQVHLYCKAPLWHPKRWTCKLPVGVDRA